MTAILELGPVADGGDNRSRRLGAVALDLCDALAHLTVVEHRIDLPVEDDDAAFTLFLDDGRVCMSNNAAECGLRGIALGRESWLFCGSDRGGQRAATMFPGGGSWWRAR
ncbi:hypothetical protein J2S34_003752 [Nitrobacter winogradskyi]|uniref:Uncharacterized protein n=1 Tax=Nitrobacter winogradskyi TaxID=913 RepID=A0ACC6APQ8_NITWI|nr:hypothetical protein [Nitrobacter winogradskyi]